MSRPFWEDAYQNPNANAFGKPSKEIIQLAHVLSPGSSVLDIGCGEGRNALFLVNQGFRVDAFDISEAGIRKLKNVATESKLTLNAWVDDITRFHFRECKRIRGFS
ncbi:MAG: methyltransferase domain-containing protein [Peptococcaceae bacterium]|nr:methyltransferase domain-containing protein [Peptococcaceae bacterium]